jgi:hypothetical protein
MRAASRWAVTAMLLLVSCVDDARAPAYPPESIDPDPAGAARERIGVRFDPLQVRAGDTIAGLVVERAAVMRTALDSIPVGRIAFRGQLRLSGRTMPHLDAEVRDAVCFEADSASASTMPRWAGDRRRPWFCFANPAGAARALGPAGTVRPATIIIDGLVIERGLSDQVNAARLVRSAR